MLRFTTNASSSFVNDILPDAAVGRERGLTMVQVREHDATFLLHELHSARMSVTPGWPRDRQPMPHGWAAASAHVRR